MKYFLATLFFVIFSTGCTINDDITTDGVKKPNGFNSVKSKTMNIDADWKGLIKKSKLVVTGKLEETLNVVDESKLYDKKSPSDEFQLPNLRAAVKGIIVRFKIDEVIYGEKKYKTAESVNIFVKDGYAPSFDSNIITFSSKERYLVFLTPVVKEDIIEGTTVIDPRFLLKGDLSSYYKSAFTVTENFLGRFQLMDSEKPIKELKEFLTKKN